jgi:hypothetical protein
MMSLADLWRGIYRHPWKTTQYIFTCFSVIFTLVKAITYFVPAIKIEGLFALTAAIVISTIFGLRKVWKPSRIEIPVAHCNTTIEIIFGDLFKQDGIRAIAVNEYFDSKLGKPVSDKSIHGLFIQKCFGPEHLQSILGRNDDVGSVASTLAAITDRIWWIPRESASSRLLKKSEIL